MSNEIEECKCKGEGVCGGRGLRIEEGDRRMSAPVGPRTELEEKQKRMQRNVLDVAKDQTLQRR